MKRLLIGILLVGIVALILPAFAVAQVAPTGDKAMLAGPVYDGNAPAFRWGLAKRAWADVWIAGFGHFGSSVELFLETAALFEISSKLYLGPVAGVGADWSSEPGTETVSAENYLIYAAGGAATFALPAFAIFSDNQVGLWGYFKYQGNPKADNLYKSGVTGGVGVYYRL